MNTLSFLLKGPIAHRGLHDTFHPENSLSAFRAAIVSGFAIETDVRLTKDDRIVIFHDANLSRMTGDPRNVSDCTAPELKRLRLNGTDEQIPLLSELLREVGGKVPLLIEIKDMKGVKASKIARRLAEILEGYEGEFAIQSFQPFYVKAFKKVRPDIACGLLANVPAKEDFDGSPIWRLKAYFVRNMSFNYTVKPDFLSWCFSDLPRRKVTRFKGPKLAWTVRSRADELKAREYADNIIFENYLPQGE